MVNAVIRAGFFHGDEICDSLHDSDFVGFALWIATDPSQLRVGKIKALFAQHGTFFELLHRVGESLYFLYRPIQHRQN